MWSVHASSVQHTCELTITRCSQDASPHLASPHLTSPAGWPHIASLHLLIFTCRPSFSHCQCISGCSTGCASLYSLLSSSHCAPCSSQILALCGYSSGSGGGTGGLDPSGLNGDVSSGAQGAIDAAAAAVQGLA